MISENTRYDRVDVLMNLLSSGLITRDSVIDRLYDQYKIGIDIEVL